MTLEMADKKKIKINKEKKKKKKSFRLRWSIAMWWQTHT
jgi:hypothetical protein